MADARESVSVISLDLASSEWRNIGAAILRDDGSSCAATLVDPPSRGRPLPNDVAEWCALLAEKNNASIVVLDGTQAWKSRTNPSPDRRHCERAFNTPSKTGLPSSVKPATYTAFTEFSIAVFDALHLLGFPRFDSPSLASNASPDDRARRTAVESFPFAAWRALGATALPSKQRCAPAAIGAAAEFLTRNLRVRLNRSPSHDEVQAVVAGLAGLALQSGRGGVRLEGEAPFVEDGIWREGFIAVPAAL